MKHFADYIKSIRASGHYAFTTEKALADLGITPNALRCGMYKLSKKHDIVSPAKNLYVIVPPEYQSLGCLPADELIPILLKHWNLPYYVGLLSAAYYYGASHQKPQTFQVITNKQIKPLICGNVRVDFIYKKNFASLPIQQHTVKTGYLAVSTPEVTAIDLLLYSRQAGGLNHVATVLSELIESIVPENLEILLNLSSEKAWIQRLGYILEHIESMEPEKQNVTVAIIRNYIEQQSLHPVALASELPTKGSSKDQRWMILENTTIESDI
ncbi:type IV toxin-antitoxin system AbiEi family antitoxin [soil metagenome]